MVDQISVFLFGSPASLCGVVSLIVSDSFSIFPRPSPVRRIGAGDVALPGLRLLIAVGDGEPSLPDRCDLLRRPGRPISRVKWTPFATATQPDMPRARGKVRQLASDGHRATTFQFAIHRSNARGVKNTRRGDGLTNSGPCRSL